MHFQMYTVFFLCEMLLFGAIQLYKWSQSLKDLIWVDCPKLPFEKLKPQEFDFRFS